MAHTQLTKTTKTLVAAAAVVALSPAFASVAYANDKIFQDTCTMLESIQGWIFGVAYVLGAIGLVLVAVSAFLGRFKFSHLIALGGGLFIVAAADMLLRFVTSGDADGKGDCVANIT